MEANKRPVGIGSTMERRDEGVSEMADGVEDLLGDDEEEGVVGEEGDDEDVDEKEGEARGRQGGRCGGMCG